MEINKIISLGVPVLGSDAQNVSRAARGEADQAQFDKTQALNQALNDSPDTRASEVARAKQLVSSLKYPPDEVVRGFARLLASRGDGSESGSNDASN